MSSANAYELYRSGLGLLEQGDHHAAALPLGRARDLEPETAMVREALGRALFGAQRYREATAEFRVLVELEPLNDYGQFCLGRALQLQGLHAQARPPLTMATLLKPERQDYRVYRDRTVAALEDGGDGSAATPDRDAALGAEDRAAGSRRRAGEGPWGAPAPGVADGAAPAEDRRTAEETGLTLEEDPRADDGRPDDDRPDDDDPPTDGGRATPPDGPGPPASA